MDMKIIKNNLRSFSLILGILIVTAVLFVQTAAVQTDIESEESVLTTTSTLVSLYAVNEADASGKITTNGTVDSERQARLTAESGGQVQQVMVGIGDTVSRGTVLLQLSANDQRAALAQAEAGLMSQQARLAELRTGTRPAELQNAELALDEARQNFLNTDLQAYVKDEDTFSSRGSLTSPEVSGVYDEEEEGVYNIELYSSGSVSGYSFRYTGLETGVGAVRTDIPQALGSRGLFIEFPEDFATNRDLEWVIPIPNTRSSNHNLARSSLQRAENNLQIALEGARSEQIQAQEAVVAQAAAGVDAAVSQLSKKTVSAPFSGEVTAVRVNTGEYVNPGQVVLELVDANNLKITTYVTSHEARQISIGDSVLLDDSYTGTVTAIASAVNAETGKIEVVVEVIDQFARLIVGDFISVQIMTSNGFQSDPLVPLTAVKNDTEGSYVLRVNKNNAAERLDVVTGSVQGGLVVITEGLNGVDAIIQDARSVTIGSAVTVN